MPFSVISQRLGEGEEAFFLDARNIAATTILPSESSIASAVA